MRSEIEQIVHILQAVKKINRIIMQSDTIDKGMQSDLLITVEGVNEVLFGNKILVDYKAYELLNLNYSPLYGESGSKSQSYCV